MMAAFLESRAELPMAKNPPRVEIGASRTRFTKVAGGDWDDRLQKVQIEVIAKNLDFNHPANGLKLHYWVLAESLVDRKTLKVIDNGVVDVNLTSDASGREMRQKGEMVTLQWDDTGAIFGERYKGWVIVLVNDKQEVVAVKANVPSWQQNFQRAFELRTGAWCGLDLKPAKGARF
jgi:hypothetical protein